MFSVSLLYSAHDFLSLVPSVGMTASEFEKYFKNFRYSSSDRILEVSFKCGWIRLSADSSIITTSRGSEIAGLDYKKALLLQLEDLILSFTPTWGSLLMKGRVEAKSFMPPEAVQCFKESGLFEDLDSNLLAFWDRMALAYRSFSNKKMLEIGRKGEQLSFDYEWSRTGVKPLWQSVESNLAGFDILSIDAKGSNLKLQIEVKATISKIDYAKIHLTRNEWNTALNSRNFVFHLWDLSISENLILVDVDQMAFHIPTDQGVGTWESVEVPFKCFC